MPQLANQQLVGPQRKLRVSQGLYKCGFEWVIHGFCG